MQTNGAVFKNAVAVIILSGLVLLAGCQEEQKAGAARPAPQVSVVEVQPQQVALTTELPGRTAPYRMAEIRPQVSGLILKRLFEEGSDITAGQVLYQIDPAPFQAALDNAKAALTQAEAKLPAIKMRADRYRALFKKGSLAKQDFDDAESEYLQAKAAVESLKAQVRAAKISLDYCQVAAPISGRIGRSNVTEGAIVTAYQTQALATIQQIDPIYVDLPQSTSELLRLKRHLARGQINSEGVHNKVKLLLDDGTVYQEQGSMQFRDVTVDPTTGSVILRAVFPNPQFILLPGMFVQAQITEGVMDGGILVPQQGVIRNFKGNPEALIVDAQGKVQQRELDLDRAIGDKWLVLKGLKAGDKVIVEGSQKVRVGMQVKAVPFERPKQADTPVKATETAQAAAESE